LVIYFLVVGSSFAGQLKMPKSFPLLWKCHLGVPEIGWRL
jgi:hypothetical protein